MITTATAVYIGGPHEGYAEPLDKNKFVVVIQVVTLPRIENPRPDYPTPTRATYYLEPIALPSGKEFYFYRWDKMSTEDALARLCSMPRRG